MATKFTFDLSLLSSIPTEERKLVKKAGLIVNGTLEIYPEYRYNCTTARVNYIVTLQRKVVSSKKDLFVLERNKGNNPIPRKISARKLELASGPENKPDYSKNPKLIVWKEKRLVPRIEFETITETHNQPVEIGSKKKIKQHEYLVTDCQPTTIKSTISSKIETSVEPIYSGNSLGQRLIIGLKEQVSPLNRVIGKLCGLQNEGKACISGQLHQTTKALHASREPNNIDEFTIWQRHVEAKHSHMRNKLQEIRPLIRGQWKEEVLFGEKGEYLGRNFTSMDEEGRRGWQPVEDVETILESEAKLIKLDPVKTPKPASDPSWKEPSWVPMQMSF